MAPLYPPSEILGLLLQQIHRAPLDSGRRREARRRGWKCSICVFPPRPRPPGDPATAPLAPSPFLERKKKDRRKLVCWTSSPPPGVQPHLWAPGAAIPRWLGPNSRRRRGQPAAGTRWSFDSRVGWDLSLARRFLSSTATSCAGLGLRPPRRPLQPREAPPPSAGPTPPAAHWGARRLQVELHPAGGRWCAGVAVTPAAERPGVPHAPGRGQAATLLSARSGVTAVAMLLPVRHSGPGPCPWHLRPSAALASRGHS